MLTLALAKAEGGYSLEKKAAKNNSRFIEQLWTIVWLSTRKVQYGLVESGDYLMGGLWKLL